MNQGLDSVKESTLSSSVYCEQISGLAFPSDKVIICFCLRRRATYRAVLLTERTYPRFLQSDDRI